MLFSLQEGERGRLIKFRIGWFEQCWGLRARGSAVGSSGPGPGPGVTQGKRIRGWESEKEVAGLSGSGCVALQGIVCCPPGKGRLSPEGPEKSQPHGERTSTSAENR